MGTLVVERLTSFSRYLLYDKVLSKPLKLLFAEVLYYQVTELHQANLVEECMEKSLGHFL